MKLDTNKRKRFRVSNKVKKVATYGRFRLSITRSAKNISAQIIDDSKRLTLVSSSSIEKDLKTGTKVNKTELSKIVAEKLNGRLAMLGIIAGIGAYLTTGQLIPGFV